MRLFSFGSAYMAICLALGLLAPGLEGAVQRAPAAGSGWLGISLTELRRTSSLDGAFRFESRFVVDAVDRTGGAAQAGVRAGDELLRIDGRPVSAVVIERLSDALAPGQAVRVDVRRGGEVQVLEVHAGMRPPGRSSTPVRDFTPVVWPSEAGSEPILVRDPAETREFTITIRMGEPGSQTWSYTMEPSTGSVDFDVYAVRTSELDSTVVSFQRLTEDLEALRFERLAGIRQEDRVLAERRSRGSREGLEERLRELKDRMAVISLGTLSDWTPQDTVFRVRVPRSRALTPYLRVGSYLLGARIQDMNSSLAQYFSVDEGVLVAEVVAGTPAALAGIQAGDVIVELNDRAIRNREDLGRIVSEASGVLRLTVMRRGQQIDLELSQE